MNDHVKTYNLSFSERPEYLYAVVEAETIDRESALRYLREVCEMCKKLECRKLILERDIPVMLSDSDLFYTTNDFLRMMRGIKIAFINPHITIEQAMEFAILIGTNRGANFSVHKSFDDAESWLLNKTAA